MQAPDIQESHERHTESGPSRNNSFINSNINDSPQDSRDSRYTPPSQQISHPVPRLPSESERKLYHEHEPWRSKNVLSLDGGGIRGYYSLLILGYLMTMVKAIEESYTDGTGAQASAISSFSPCNQPLHVSHSASTQDSSDHDSSPNYFLPCHYFDYICGTSTGGLIAIMLSRLRMTVDDCIQEYLNLGGRIFGKPRRTHQLVKPLFWLNRTKYDAKILENVIQDVTNRRGNKGSGSRFEGELDLCRSFVFAYKKITDNQRAKPTFEPPYILRSYPHWNGGTQKQTYPRNPGDAAPYHIWQVARATTAAPLYFDPMELSDDYVAVTRRTTLGRLTRPARERTTPSHTFIDGGFGLTNNPAEEAYHEVITSNHCIETFVSIGTGRRTTDRFGTGLVKTVSAAVDALGDPEAAHVNMIPKSEGEEGKEKFHYFRFNKPNALPTIDFDEWKPRSNGDKTLEKMRGAFQAWALEPEIQKSFQECAAQLVRRRRLRTVDSSRWERFALGSYFICPGKVCPDAGNKKWENRTEFQNHLIAVHGKQPANIREVADEFQKIWLYKNPPRRSPTV